MSLTPERGFPVYLRLHPWACADPFAPGNAPSANRPPGANQAPAKVSAAVDRFVADNTPRGIRYGVNELAAGSAYMCPPDNSGINRASAAAAAGFGKRPTSLAVRLL